MKFKEAPGACAEFAEELLSFHDTLVRSEIMLYRAITPHEGERPVSADDLDSHKSLVKS